MQHWAWSKHVYMLVMILIIVGKKACHLWYSFSLGSSVWPFQTPGLGNHLPVFLPLVLSSGHWAPQEEDSNIVANKYLCPWCLSSRGSGQHQEQNQNWFLAGMCSWNWLVVSAEGLTAAVTIDLSRGCWGNGLYCVTDRHRQAPKPDLFP